MQKVISKYATAAHLAFIAVAPLFLLPFCGAEITSTVLLWLSAFAALWVMMEPSRRNGEMPHDARARVFKTSINDPLFWFAFVLVAYAGIRALNGGVMMKYDAELMQWSLSSANMSLLPSSVGSSGYFPFAAVVALAVIFQGARFVLGRSARAAFLLVCSFLSGLSAIALAFAISYRHAGALALMSNSSICASFFGTAFGITLLCSVVAVFATVERKWMRAEPLAGLGLIGNALGLAMFAPPLTIAVFLVAFLILVILSFVLTRHLFEGSGSFRCSLVLLLALIAPVLYVLASEDIPAIGAKITAFKDFQFFPDGFFPQRDALSAVALRSWKDNPWLGTGLDSFPLDIRFLATSADWKVLSPMQVTSLNGWWQLLAERGVIGALIMATTVGMLLWTYFSRLVSSFRDIQLSPMHLLCPLLLLALIAISFFNCSYLRPEVLILAGAAIAISGGALPVREKKSEDGKGH